MVCTIVFTRMQILLSYCRSSLSLVMLLLLLVVVVLQREVMILLVTVSENRPMFIHARVLDHAVYLFLNRPLA